MKKTRFDSNLTKYQLMAGVVLAGASSSAEIQYNTNINELVSIGGGSFGLDFDGGGEELTFSVWQTVYGSQTQLLGNVNPNSSVSLLASGSDLIPMKFGSSFFNSSLHTGIAYLFLFSTGVRQKGVFDPSDDPIYIGTRFDSGDGARYGWVSIEEIAPDYSSFRVTGYAYDDAGDFITAGAIPEPSSLALLALGAAGVRAIRRFNNPKG